MSDRARLLGAGLLIALLAFPGAGRADDLPEQLDGWPRVDHKTFVGMDLYQHINGGAELYHEYGFTRVTVGYYGKDDREILIERYEMADEWAAAGLYSMVRDPSSATLPAPYTGRQYDLYLECISGSQYIKVIGTRGGDAQALFALLKALLPAPPPPGWPALEAILPTGRLPDSEVLMRGPLALRNFGSLGRAMDFGVGQTTRAYGCRVLLGGESRRWLTLVADDGVLAAHLERYLAYQAKNDYQVTASGPAHILIDGFSGKAMVLTLAGDRLHAVFDLAGDEPTALAAEIVEMAAPGPELP